MDRQKLSRLSLILIMLLSAAAMAFGASVKLTVQSPSCGGRIGVGDLFYVIYTLENVSGTPPQGNIPGAKMVYMTQSSMRQSFTSINGHHSEQTVIEYTGTYRATEAGSFTYGPISVGGTRSNSIRYNIGKTSESASPSNASGSPASDPSAQSGPKFIGKGDGNLFLRASVSKTTAYEQEALVYTVKLYSSYSRIKFVGATAAPKFEGFVIEESKQTDTQLRMEQYNGRSYATAVIARYIIFPQMKGNLKVIGNTYTVSVDQAEYYRDSYFGTMTVGRPLQFNVTPNDLSITVKPLPEPKPADFCGGVGKFSITSSMPSTHLKTNETGSIVYTVTGSGNLKYVQLPDLSMIYPSQIDVFSPQTDVKANVSGSTVSGSVRFDYSLMPTEEGDFRIPDVTLVYFNPETGQYEKSVARGYNVTVGKGSASSKSQTRKKLHYDDSLMETGDVSKEHIPNVYIWYYWFCFILPVVILVITIISYRKYLKENADLSAVLSRKAGKIAQKRLRKAAVCLKKGDEEHFYDEILLALWGYLGDKLKMPTSELSRDNVSDVLTGAGIEPDAVKKIMELIDACEFVKYSSDRGQQSMQNVYDEAASVINQLEESFKHIRK